MKNLARGFIVLACLVTTASAVPELRVGETNELFITGRLGVHFDDNVLLSDVDELTDTVFEIAPGLEFKFGQGALTTGAFTYVESITRYIDNDFLDRELSSVAFVTQYDDEKVKFGVDSYFKQLNQNTRDVRGPFPVRRDVFSVALSTELQATQKSSVGAGLIFDRTDFKRAGYVDISELSVPLNYYYHFAPKVDLSAGLRYRESELSRGALDSTDYFYNVGARGQFTPKLSGQFNIGFNQRRLDRGGNENSVGAESAFRYMYSEKTAIRFGIGNDFSTSAEGDSQKNFMLTGGVETQFSPQWQGAASVTYRKIEYFGGRTDDFIDGQISVKYIVSTHVRVGASYEFRKNDSDYAVLEAGRLRSADFTNNVLSLVVELRY